MTPEPGLEGPPTGRPAGWFARARRVPLLTKIVVLDLMINVTTYVLLQLTPPEHTQAVTLVSLVVVGILNAALVAWALQPLQVIEDTARRVSDGHFDARVGVLPGLADGNLARIAQTLDGLLDRVASERARVRTLAAQVVKAGDAERARIARELHDGTAQQLTALEMLLTSAQADAPQSALAERLSLMHSIATESLAEVRNLSHTVHPRVLDDLGLPAALEWLARRSGAPELTVHVLCEVDGQIPAPLASVLYRVTQEALQNAIRHGAARHVDVTVRHVDGCVELRIEDDGRGFDGARPPADAASGLDGVPTGRQPGMGLFVMQERVSLLDGQLTIDSRPGAGTRILARLPFGDRT